MQILYITLNMLKVTSVAFDYDKIQNIFTASYSQTESFVCTMSECLIWQITDVLLTEYQCFCFISGQVLPFNLWRSMIMINTTYETIILHLKYILK